jgi:hypothetical protein
MIILWLLFYYWNRAEQVQLEDERIKNHDVLTGILVGSYIATDGLGDVRDSGAAGWDSGRERSIDGGSVWEFGSVWGFTDKTLSGRLSDPDSPTIAYPTAGIIDRNRSDWSDWYND